MCILSILCVQLWLAEACSEFRWVDPAHSFSRGVTWRAMFAGLRPGFLAAPSPTRGSGSNGGQRRLSAQRYYVPLSQQQLREALALFVGNACAPGETVYACVCLTESIRLSAKNQHALYLQYVLNPSRAAEEAAFSQYAFGTPETSDGSFDSDDEEGPDGE